MADARKSEAQKKAEGKTTAAKGRVKKTVARPRATRGSKLRAAATRPKAT